MDAKISKLEDAAQEAHRQMKARQGDLEKATLELAQAKDNCRSLPQSEQETLQVNDTEIPEMLESHLRAKQEFEAAEARYDTNQRYLAMMKEKANN
jgi:hypothetical protein